MSFVADIARESLKAAQKEWVRSRRFAWAVAALLVLVHLVTVSPYLEAAAEIDRLEVSIEAHDSLLTLLEGEVGDLQSAGSDAAASLAERLKSATQKMILDFQQLEGLVGQALEGSMPNGQLGGPSLVIQQPLEPREAQYADIPSELLPVLRAIAAGEEEGFARLAVYARGSIVEAAYEGVQREWDQEIRPSYLAALRDAGDAARKIGETARTLTDGDDTATKLLAMADQAAMWRETIEGVTITVDSDVDAALETEWWRTESGKDVFAAAVLTSVKNQVDRIDASASEPLQALRNTLSLRQDLYDTLVKRQAALERQFEEQRRQIATLSGAGGVLPVDLVSFIGLFPLVIGAVFAVLAFRSANIRRDAALAIVDLRRAAPQEDDAIAWLSRRLGARDMLGQQLATVGLALAAIAWVLFAAWQIRGSDLDPPLSTTFSATLAICFLAAAGAWDFFALRRLVAAAEGRED